MTGIYGNRATPITGRIKITLTKYAAHVSKTVIIRGIKSMDNIMLLIIAAGFVGMIIFPIFRKTD
jgi:hypothetical protein